MQEYISRCEVCQGTALEKWKVLACFGIGIEIICQCSRFDEIRGFVFSIEPSKKREMLVRMIKIPIRSGIGWSQRMWFVFFGATRFKVRWSVIWCHTFITYLQYGGPHLPEICLWYVTPFRLIRPNTNEHLLVEEIECRSLEFQSRNMWFVTTSHSASTVSFFSLGTDVCNEISFLDTQIGISWFLASSSHETVVSSTRIHYK